MSAWFRLLDLVVEPTRAIARALASPVEPTAYLRIQSYAQTAGYAAMQFTINSKRNWMSYLATSDGERQPSLLDDRPCPICDEDDRSMYKRHAAAGRPWLWCHQCQRLWVWTDADWMVQDKEQADQECTDTQSS